MASPPFDIAHTTPQDNDIISQFPGTERTFRDIVESWLTLLSDPTTGLLDPAAVPVPFTLTTATTGNPMLTLESTEAGAGSGPAIELYRNSASPAASDVLGVLYWYGEDSAGNKQEYAALFPSIVDATSGSEDATMQLRLTVAGTPTARLTANAAGVVLGGALSGPTSITSTGDISGTTGTFSGAVSTTSNLFITTSGATVARVRYSPSGGAGFAIRDDVAAADRLSISASGTITLAGDLSGTTGTFSGAVSMAGLTATTGTFSGGITLTTLDVSSSIETPTLTLEGATGIMRWEDETDMWIRRLSAGVMQFVTAGVQRALIDTTGLDVNGTLTATAGISTGGDITVSGGDIIGVSRIEAPTTLVLAANATTIFLRPNGDGSAVAETNITSAGDMHVNGNITSVADGIHTNNKTASNPATAGCSMTVGGQLVAAINDVFLIGNRLSSDGSLIHLRQANVTEGTISVAGGTVTYGAFLGSHWAQLTDNSNPEILKGTVCETINEMSLWPDEPRVNDRLPKFKVSDTVASSSVYGIFLTWDEDGDALISSIGAGWVRIDAGEIVTKGDLLESAGNGCAKVQVDNIMRASTIGKVSATVVVETYNDGSYLVPCTLHCG